MISVLLCLGADFMTCGTDVLCKASSVWLRHMQTNCFSIIYNGILYQESFIRVKYAMFE